MKKITFPILLFSILAHAQAYTGFSATAGATLSSLKSNDLQADPGLGFRTGVEYSFGDHESFNYQIEMMFNQSTLKLLTIDENYLPAGTTNLNFSTVDLAFFFNYYVVKPDYKKFYIGPQVGFDLAFKAASEASGGDQSYYLPYRLQDMQLMDTPDFSYSAGFGITGGYGRFRFDFRYNMGLNNFLQYVKTNSYDEFNRYTGPSLDGKLSYATFALGYVFSGY